MPNLFFKKHNSNIGLVWKERLGLILILIVMLVLMSRRIYDPTVNGNADAHRHLMDGVFILDFLREMPIGNVYDFTANYYAQYPALSIGYHPPFFPFIEALFNGIFGINIWSSRLSVLFFAVVGVIAWFKLVKSVFNNNTAFWTSMLLVTTPFVVRRGWEAMAEIPALSMTMLTAYVFYRYTETRRPGYLYASAIIFCLTVWTKQTTIFILPWFLLFLAIKKQFLVFFRSKEGWIAIICIIVLLIPLALITLWLGDENVKQSIGAVDPQYRWYRIKFYLLALVKNQLTRPVLILCITGIGCAAWKRDNRCVYFALLVICVYIFFSYLVVQEARYTIFWMPAFCLFAVLPVLYLRKSKIFYVAGNVVLSFIVIYQISLVYYKTLPIYIKGCDEAVRYILRENPMPVVFFDGSCSSYFTYLMRSLDSKKSMYVLRGDKLLSSHSIYPKKNLKVHAHSREDIEKIFDKYGILYIVVQNEDWTGGIEIHQELRVFLDSGPFRLVEEFPIESNINDLKGAKLKIYKYLNAKPIIADYLELRLPSVGQMLKIPIRHLQATKQSIP